MPPRFDLPPQTTQYPQSRRQSHKKSLASSRATPHSLPQSQQWSTLRPPHEEVQHNQEEYHPLKRKVTSDHSQNVSDAAFAQSFSSLAPPQASQTHGPSKTAMPSSATSANRELLAPSQLSKMLAPAVQGVSGRHLGPQRSNQPTHARSGEPAPHDTIPSQTPQPTRNRKSSERPRFNMKDASPLGPTHKPKRKEKFRPPLVNGGHAERLWNLMQDQKSEYAVWLSTSSRPVATLESTEPLAVVEIRSIFWDHRLQWTRCAIIDSRKNREPFALAHEDEERLGVIGQENTEHQDGDLEHVCYRSPSQLLSYRTPLRRDDSMQDDSCATQQTDPASISDGSQDERVRASLEADDSIFGLHYRMGDMIVLESSQGSLYAGTPLATQKHMLRDTGFLGPIQEDEEERQSDLIKHLQSSQGSIEGEEVEEYGRRRGMQPAVQSNIMNINEFSSDFGEPTRDGTSSDPIAIDLDETMEPGIVSTRTNSAISSIAEIVSPTSESTNDLTDPTDNDPIDDDSQEPIKSPTRAPSPEVNDHLSQETTGDKDAHRQVDLIFSNLFSWTNLKIKDRVEIHEPCRKIAFSKGSGGYVLIAERYRVLSH
ncbi:hypothetical protein CPB97_004681 [Podila verticillata]|nr:hypothetical protein CPB97_004681 [Podila verticillata]